MTAAANAHLDASLEDLISKSKKGKRVKKANDKDYHRPANNKPGGGGNAGDDGAKKQKAYSAEEKMDMSLDAVMQVERGRRRMQNRGGGRYFYRNYGRRGNYYRGGSSKRNFGYNYYRGAGYRGARGSYYSKRRLAKQLRRAEAYFRRLYNEWSYKGSGRGSTEAEKGTGKYGYRNYGYSEYGADSYGGGGRGNSYYGKGRGRYGDDEGSDGEYGSFRPGSGPWQDFVTNDDNRGEYFENDRDYYNSGYYNRNGYNRRSNYYGRRGGHNYRNNRYNDSDDESPYNRGNKFANFSVGGGKYNNRRSTRELEKDFLKDHYAKNENNVGSNTGSNGRTTELPPSVAKFKGSGRLVQITNCPGNLAKKELKEAFEDIGTINVVDMNKPACIAWLVFEESKDAYEAEHQFDGGEINGSTIKIEIM
ncbi:unnamed protein product [Amoebophrya sp. A120]|nr:unnamed protein product [Amoebophrya sp. A120]|eukprot:GSA120T00014173001.1